MSTTGTLRVGLTMAAALVMLGACQTVNSGRSGSGRERGRRPAHPGRRRQFQGGRRAGGGGSLHRRLPGDAGKGTTDVRAEPAEVAPPASDRSGRGCSEPASHPLPRGIRLRRSARRIVVGPTMKECDGPRAAIRAAGPVRPAPENVPAVGRRQPRRGDSKVDGHIGARIRIRRDRRHTGSGRHLRALGSGPLRLRRKSRTPGSLSCAICRWPGVAQPRNLRADVARPAPSVLNSDREDHIVDHVQNCTSRRRPLPRSRAGDRTPGQEQRELPGDV